MGLREARGVGGPEARADGRGTEVPTPRAGARPPAPSGGRAEEVAPGAVPFSSEPVALTAN